MSVARVIVGDCIDSMRAMPDASVHCCVTSPPYFGLRDYGHDGQIGLESTPEAFVAKLVEVFREVRRVLRDDGTLWLNLGDSYASAWAMPGGRRNVAGQGSLENGKREARPNRLVDGLKEKDLIGIPWRVAFALQADGWYLRQDIIWSKPNPMPESVRDRCTKAHEYLFLLTKSPRYYFDADAIAEPLAASSIARLSQATIAEQAGSDRVPGKTNGPMKAVSKYRNSDGTLRAGYETKGGTSGDLDGTLLRMGEKGVRNRRSVWTVTTKPFKGAHFATFPPDLIEPCILAGCPEGGTVLDPFGGAGTTGLVAERNGRDALLCELNPDYAALAEDRIAAARPVEDIAKRDHLDLFEAIA